MIPALLVILVVVFAAIVWLTTTQPAAVAAGGDDPAARLQEIDRIVKDPRSRFSVSVTLNELDGLSRRLAAGDAAAQGRVAYLRGFILNKAGRAAESIHASIEALAIHERAPFLADRERSRFVYNLATQAEDLSRWDTAIDAYREAIALFDADPTVTEDQRLGTRERLAYCLHESQRYGEAMEVNRQVLAGGELLFGADSDKLLVVVTNLAQNAHALGDPAEARGFLDRRLDIATRHGVEDHIDDSLFQLGVLAFETGETDEAERFMQRRLELAEAAGDKARIAAAREDLEILHDKLRR